MRLAVLLAALAAPAAAQPPLTLGAATYVRAPKGWQAAWFACDPIGANDLIVAGEPRKARVTLWRMKRDASLPWKGDFTLGRADPGAGQIYFALSAKGRERGNIHGINPGMADPNPRLPSISSVTLDNHRTQCRMADGAILLAMTTKRSLIVSRERGGLVYRAFEPGKTTPAIRLARGEAVPAGNGIAYRFTNKGYDYRLVAGHGTAGGTLTVTRGGKVELTEPFVAYSMAR
ncbi:hypothetical protein PQ455_08050 [Sphingomonas naphthae]|uniref:Uncharacterized protein n=1 Tax=Sphingomonas naphthae TaxID=1813468 RepID=A0ABY7TQ91_9SPHN|nr:hypothetical protein [Sphingomonas naphthae]WCT75156.1 hypothetical protein PQ455_08050 [Sphingomonas naphthae]